MKVGDRVSILDRGWIELQDVMGSDLAIVNAARTSFLGESKGETADKKLLLYLMRNAHTSPFEMAELKFRVHAPLVTWWQWVRHRTANINMSSGRYSEFLEGEFYVPVDWRLQSSSNKQASNGTLESVADASWLTSRLEDFYAEGYRLYQQALGMGVAKEQARLFLPGFAVYYTGVWKCDLHNILHFLKLRMDTHAQYEIRVYAQAMYDNFVKPLFPWTAEAFEQYVLGVDDGSKEG